MLGLGVVLGIVVLGTIVVVAVLGVVVLGVVVLGVVVDVKILGDGARLYTDTFLKIFVLFVKFCWIKVSFVLLKKFEVDELERNLVVFVKFEEFFIVSMTLFTSFWVFTVSGKARTEPSGVSTHMYKPVEYIGILLIVLLIPQTRLQLRKLESPDIINPLNKKNIHHTINFGYIILLFM